MVVPSQDTIANPACQSPDNKLPSRTTPALLASSIRWLEKLSGKVLVIDIVTGAAGGSGPEARIPRWSCGHATKRALATTKCALLPMTIA